MSAYPKMVLLSVFFLGSSQFVMANSDAALGSNLNEGHYWSSEWLFIDEMKRSSRWFTQCPQGMPGCGGLSAWDTGEQDQLDLDPHGWVRSLPAADDTSHHYRAVAALMFRGGGGHHPAGQYVVRYQGEGTIEYDFDAVKNQALSSPGRDVLEVTPSNNGILLRITATDPADSGEYLRDIQVFWPGGVCNDDPRHYAPDAAACEALGASYTPLEALDPTQHFHPRFIQDMAPLRVLRYMDLMKGGASPLVDWQDRPSLRDRRWSTEAGVPVEIPLRIARATGTDAWVHVPPRANDRYVERFAREALRELPEPLKIYLEYGNEVWNTAFPAGRWVEEQARERWPDGEASDYSKRLNGYGMRAAQVCQLWKRVWKHHEDRVVCVVGAMAANPWVARQTLNCPLWQAQSGESCRASVDALAIAPYFGHYLGQPRLHAAVAAWGPAAEGGLDALFRELQEGSALVDPQGKIPADGALAQATRDIIANAQVAEEFGLSLMAYEGGQHLVVNGDGPHREALEALFLAANRDSRMYSLYQDYLTRWRDNGGQLLVHFTSVNHPSRYGSFGAREHQQDLEAPKFRALRDFLATNPCWWSGCQRPAYTLPGLP